jgi:predicted small secreted protein
MVTKKSVIILLVLSLFVLSSCTQTNTKSGPVGEYANCNGDGSQMITAKFADFAPVSSETDTYQPGEEIDVEVVLTNLYTRNIAEGNAKVRLTGDAAITSIFSGAKETMAENLYSIDTETCLEETTEVSVGPIIYNGEISSKIAKEITGLYCYQEPVVVKAFLYYTAKEEEIGDNLPAGANPPSSVQVTQIEQNPVDVDPGEPSGQMRFKIYLANLGTGTIIPSLGDCFEYRDVGYREEFDLSVTGAYSIDCPEKVTLTRGEKTDVVTCLVTGIDSTNLGEQASEITITLSGFAYEDSIPSTTIWLEP